MAIDLVNSSDPRFADLNRSRASGRWPSPGQEAAAIALCSTAEDVRVAVEQAVKAGKRPTIISGGHCYENFVLDNPGGTIIDVKPMSGVTQDPTTKRWKIESGATVGDMYWGMYSKGGVTIPAASCTTVGVGGHISGVWHRAGLDLGCRDRHRGRQGQCASADRGQEEQSRPTARVPRVGRRPVWRDYGLLLG